MADQQGNANKTKRTRSTKPRVTNGTKVTPKTGVPASQRVTSDPCPMCHSEDTHVYATRGIKRYCKCRHCGWTWAIASYGNEPAGPVESKE